MKFCHFPQKAADKKGNSGKNSMGSNTADSEDVGAKLGQTRKAGGHKAEKRNGNSS